MSFEGGVQISIIVLLRFECMREKNEEFGRERRENRIWEKEKA